ncbi:MAG: DUF4625 domain-containing protein [Flavobacteriales bacterium]|nr:DUF4625 domain-containing protein [Flavobacteriales bacterium]
MNKSIVYLVIAATFASCAVEEDTTNPVITSLKVNGTVADEHSAQGGSMLTVEVAATDNERLNQIKVSVHSADDGHTHHGQGADEIDHPNTATWGENEIKNASGTSDSETFSFDVPDSVGGRWHIEVVLLDESGNESEETATVLHVVNDNLPVFTITGTNPDVNVDGEIPLPVGGTPEVEGSVADPDGLAQIIATIIEVGMGEDIIHTIDIAPLGSNSFALSAISFDPIDVAGDYTLRLYALDVEGYYSLWEFSLHVE